MKLREYINNYYPCMNIINDHKITHITDNSKKILKNSIFVVLDNGVSYIEEAISKGAKTIILAKKLKNIVKTKNNRVNYLFVEHPKADLARILKMIYLERHKKMPILIAVTGTAGKTTSSSIIYQVIKKLGYDVLLIGSNGNYSYFGSFEKHKTTRNTTPSISIIYELMNEHNLSYDYVIIEVSSQGVVEGRVLDFEFDYSLITSFYKEHLEYHSNLSEYRNAKARILNNTKKMIVINSDMNSFNFFNELNTVKKLTFGVNSGDIRLEKIENENLFMIRYCNKSYLINNRLEGDFNLQNITGAFTLLLQLDFNEIKLLEAINNIEPILGRMNLIYNEKQKIYVDYAHTITGVEEVLKYFSELKENRIITVIGCGGERDKSRRPIIGKLATTYSDLVIFTEDNSRSENPRDIINEIISGCENNNYFIEIDRYKAIKLAYDISKKEDIVLILGKGNENTLVSKDKNIEFNDIEIVKEIVKGENK